MEYYSVVKNDNAISVAWMEVEISSLSEDTTQTSYDITYVWTLNYDARELLDKTETVSEKTSIRFSSVAQSCPTL